jgi:predicted ArsR family transcriptional regulator
MSAPVASEHDLSAVALLDEPVRRRLYEWVAAQDHPVGREEAAKTLGITRPLAAFHLERLAEAGLLDAGYQRLTGRTGPGAGRPARVYTRTRREIAVTLPPRHYDLVADVFAAALQRMGDGGPPPQLLDAAHDAGADLAQANASGSDGSLLGVLEHAGYEPVQVDGTIRLRNCPFDALVEQHRPLVCGTNLAMARGMLDGLPEGGAGFEPRLDPHSGYCCVVFSSQDGDA